MKLELGPVELQTEFIFDILNLFKEHSTTVDSIGLYFSGGIDSTALLLLIIAELKNIGKLHAIPIYCYSIVKQDFATIIAPKILTTIQNKFDVHINHVNYIENYKNYTQNINIKTFLDIFLQYKNRFHFVANNRMPDESLVRFKNKLNIDYGHDKNKVFYYSPFLFLHKPQILDIFYKLKCEDIIPYTYSCTIHQAIPCQNCYACEERAWGFKMLNKIDPLVTQNHLSTTNQ